MPKKDATAAAPKSRRADGTARGSYYLSSRILAVRCFYEAERKMPAAVARLRAAWHRRYGRIMNRPEDFIKRWVDRFEAKGTVADGAHPGRPKRRGVAAAAAEEKEDEEEDEEETE